MSQLLITRRAGRAAAGAILRWVLGGNPSRAVRECATKPPSPLRVPPRAAFIAN